MTVRLGVPSKGRLMEKTFAWFERRGITLTRTGSDREYAGAVGGIDGVSLVLLSAGFVGAFFYWLIAGRGAGGWRG